MRAVPEELRARLATGVTTLCRCWLVERRDGRRMGFTDHDEDVAFGGDVYAASTGMTAAALQLSTGLDVDNSQVAGALSAAGLTEADIAAGLYDGARVTHWLVDWRRPDLRVQIFAGRLGEVVRGGIGFEVELRGLAEALARPVGRVFLRDCDAVFGDGRCRADLSVPGRVREGTVASVRARGRFLAGGLEGSAAGWFARGRIEWLSGANAGSAGQVKQDLLLAEGRLVELWEEPAGPVAVGDGFRVTAGCDKRAETCREKFGNLENFRGFPHLPGEDWVNGYVRDGDRHDGASLFR